MEYYTGLEKIRAAELKKCLVEAMEGDIDNRDANLKDISLPPGFENRVRHQRF